MFKLKDSVKMVLGATRGALLALESGKVYSVNEIAVKVLCYDLEDELYWRSLCEASLAEECQNQPDSTTYILSKSTAVSADTNKLRFIWLEVVSDGCNLRCLHCYADSGVGNKSVGESMRFEDWERVLRQAYQAGCRKCQLIGGEPFLYRDGNRNMLDLVRAAHACGYDFVEVYTNGTLMTADAIALFSELGTHVALSMYSSRPEIHDRVTGVDGSHAQTVRAIDMLLASGIKTRVEVVVMRTNQDTVEETIAYLRSKGVSTGNPDPLRPTGRGVSEELFPDLAVLQKYGVLMKPDFTCSERTVRKNMAGNPCLNGKLAITSSGVVFPCIFARGWEVGNARTMDIETVLQEFRLVRVWGSTKDSVLVCRDCEYRYCCRDCRVLAGGSTDHNNFLSNPYPRCSYNPYTGEWGSGLWKVDGNGVPFYERFS
ncbi:MAG: radical SAM protein [Patescibacteria group bacterium]